MCMYAHYVRCYITFLLNLMTCVSYAYPVPVRVCLLVAVGLGGCWLIVGGAAAIGVTPSWSGPGPLGPPKINEH